MKNAENRPIRIVRDNITGDDVEYGRMLQNLAIAEAMMVKAGKQSGLNHFIAVVKEIERMYKFHFEVV